MWNYRSFSLGFLVLLLAGGCADQASSGEPGWTLISADTAISTGAENNTGVGDVFSTQAEKEPVLQNASPESDDAGGSALPNSSPVSSAVFGRFFYDG